MTDEFLIRNDIDPANTWVTSDSHFGHRNIVGFCHRPEDHESIMIDRWAGEVPPEATVIHLGDLAYKSNAMFRAVHAPKLTGRRKLLILGNHDKQRYSFYKKAGFKLARPFAIEYGPHEEYVIQFSHYPAREPLSLWTWRLHGHIHNLGYTRQAFVPFLRNHINLSVEQTKYRPVNLKLLLDAVLLGEYPADDFDASGEVAADAADASNVHMREVKAPDHELNRLDPGRRQSWEAPLDQNSRKQGGGS
jgi:calcineurin-like phosphoesterase family protein